MPFKVSSSPFVVLQKNGGAHCYAPPLASAPFRRKELRPAYLGHRCRLYGQCIREDNVIFQMDMFVQIGLESFNLIEQESI